MKSYILVAVRAAIVILAAADFVRESQGQWLPRQTPNPVVSPGPQQRDANETSPVGAVRLLAPVPVPADQETLPPTTAPSAVPLTVEGVVQNVLARNQSLAQMAAAWQAASQRYPQLTSRDDPMFSGMAAPSSFGSRTVEPGYRLEVSQKILWPGKKNLRGEMALADADAAGSDVQDMKLQLTEMARNAYYEYFLVHRSLDVNNDALKLLDESRRNAEARFRTGQAATQDILQADVEIGKQRERGIALERMRRVAIARLNTLMHQAPDDPLALPPVRLVSGNRLPPAPQLIAAALGHRPDLRALEARIVSDRAALALAMKDYWPDVEVAAAYDTIMGNGPMRDLAPEIGLRMNLPVRTAKRNAAVAEAQAKIAQRSAELAARIDQVKFQVQEAYELALESERVLELYEGKILPQAAESVKAAQNAYVTGTTPFVSLIEAQRSLIALRERSFEASADSFRRRAALSRLVGHDL